MPTINDEVEDAALECGLGSRSGWIAATDDSARQIVRLLPVIARDLLDRHDWSGASKTADVEPVAEQATWTLPSDFNRLQRGDNAVYEVSPNRRPIIPIAGDGSWNETTAWGYAGAQRFYRRTGTAIEFYRPLPAGSEVKIAYVSNNWIIGNKAEWTDAADVAVFPSGLLRFGIIYRWRKQKGMRYADEQSEYETILARAIGDDRPRRSISYGRSNMQTHPMRVPIPDFIGDGT